VGDDVIDVLLDTFNNENPRVLSEDERLTRSTALG
jgi:hypothetical protein